MARERAYLIYPYALYGSSMVEKFKASLKEKYEFIDPFEVVGVGDAPQIAAMDMRLLEDCDRVVAFLPCEGLQSGWELCYAFMKGKKITVYIKPDLTGPFINWMGKNGVEINILLQ